MGKDGQLSDFRKFAIKSERDRPGSDPMEKFDSIRINSLI